MPVAGGHIVIRHHHRKALDKSQVTIIQLFVMLLSWPTVADMYRAGYAITGSFQTCNIHLYRKVESLAIKHGKDSPEYAIFQVMVFAYADIAQTAKITLERAGGPDATAADIGRATRTVPGLAECVTDAKNHARSMFGTIEEVYRTGKVSDEKNRKMADTIHNAAPYMVMCFDHPSMSYHTEGIELVI